MWSILHTQPMVRIVDNGFIVPTYVRGVLSIEEDEQWGHQRARFTDGVNSETVDVAWAWAQMEHS